MYLFQRKLCNFLSSKLKDFSNIYCFADGAAAQHKSKEKFIDLCYHKDGFDMDAERYFFPSHSIGAYDWIVGTIKGG